MPLGQFACKFPPRFNAVDAQFEIDVLKFLAAQKQFCGICLGVFNNEINLFLCKHGACPSMIFFVGKDMKYPGEYINVEK